MARLPYARDFAELEAFLEIDKEDHDYAMMSDEEKLQHNLRQAKLRELEEAAWGSEPEWWETEEHDYREPRRLLDP